jgi:ubiquinone/menaquinone biosynthesis C-methylase UbiE
MSPQDLFSDSIPENYDKYLGPYLFEPYAMDLVERIRNDDCKMLLELAYGTGRVTNHLVEVIGDNGKIVATDINNDMVQLAKTKVVDNRITWQVADAQELPFHNNSFDHVVCQFGVMFFPDRLKAFEEAHRVLVEKGKFLFNTWGSLEENRGTGLIKDVLEEVFNEEAPEFLQKGPYSFYDTNTIESLLKSAGFTNISIEPVRKVAEYADVEHFIKGFLNGTPLSAFLTNRLEAVRKEVNQRLKQSLSKQSGESMTSEMLAYVGVGKK